MTVLYEWKRIEEKEEKKKKKDAFGCDCGGVEMMERNRVGWGSQYIHSN